VIPRDKRVGSDETNPIFFSSPGKIALEVRYGSDNTLETAAFCAVRESAGVATFFWQPESTVAATPNMTTHVMLADAGSRNTCVNVPQVTARWDGHQKALDEPYFVASPKQ